MRASCKCKRWLTGVCRSCGEQSLETGWREGIEEEGCEVGAKRQKETWVNERTDGSWALSTGSLGHSYASAVGTITKPRLLHKMLPKLVQTLNIRAPTYAESDPLLFATTRRIGGIIAINCKSNFNHQIEISKITNFSEIFFFSRLSR